MIKVYRQSDRIPVQIGDAKFLIKPISNKEKIEILSNHNMEGGVTTVAELGVTFDLIKFAVKGVEGIFYHDGTPVELLFEDSGTLKDESVEELMSMEISGELKKTLTQMVNSIPTEIVGTDGKRIKNIKILPLTSSPVKKK